MLKRHRIVSAAAALAVFGTLALCASPALALSPWWHLTSQSLPSYVARGGARDEVQQLIVSATGGRFFLGRKEGEKFVGLALLEFNEATHEGPSSGEVQTALESAPGEYDEGRVHVLFGAMYGKGNVQVAGGPGDVEGSKPYTITFTGEFADQPVTSLFAGYFFSNLLEGGRREVKATELVHGRADGEIVVNASNLGDAAANGKASPVTIADTLPAGLVPVSIIGTFAPATPLREAIECSLKTLRCTYTGKTAPFQQITVEIGVNNAGARSGEVNQASIVGGGAQPVNATSRITAGETTPFGISNYELVNEDEGGRPDRQAGSHPFQQTTTVTLNQTINAHGVPEVAQMAKDLHFRWPAGLVGNPTPFPQCPLAQFLTETGCPPQTALGVVSLATTEHNDAAFVGPADPRNLLEPLFNLVPSLGEPARFAFKSPAGPVYIDPLVRSGEDYGITVNSENITESVAFRTAEVTVWGVPGEASHDSVRGSSCLAEDQGFTLKTPCEPLRAEHPAAFLQLPTSCTGSLHSEVYGDSWLERMPTVQQPLLASFPMPALDGCEALPFHPSIKVTPDSVEASKPTGLNVDVHVPQAESLNAQGLAVSDPRTITVALPEGVAVNPAGGDGLQACSQALVGFEGFKELATQPGSTAIFTPRLPGSYGSEEALRPGANFCANGSKIGTVTVRTPLLPNPIKGAVYLASQDENPFGSLLAMYIVAEDPVSGVVIKLAGQVHLSETGQIVTTFENSPQAPFEDAELHFFGGERAPLASPARCGTYTTTAAFTPWSSQAGEPPVAASSAFNITAGPNGSPCPGASLPFSPSLHAGASSIQAGGFSPFTTTMGREDGQQNLQAINLHMPPGLSGLLTGVELCPEPQADQGLCGPNSLIGETTVSVGLGGDPFSVKGGKVYLTGSYNGHGSCAPGSPGCVPFGLSIVNPAKAGPFDLEKNTPCDCVVVRAKLAVDPVTAAITVTSDNEGPYKIPTILKGIPLQIKHVYVNINRPGFTFNPTNCNPQAITGTLDSTEGASQALSVPFQVTNCANLGFAPKFAVSTSGKTSKANGASLSVKLTYPNAPFGSQANIKQVKVELPIQLPSRLTTLQKACTAVQFKTNPAGCPAASIIGHAKAVTPLIPVPLEGPAYFVSNGGEAFPNLIVVLQGYGVTIDLVGDTFISKAGITSSTFKTVPDAPVGSFELTLPEGKYSALAANGDLCSSTRTVPVKRRVTIRVKGRRRTVTRMVRQTLPTSLTMPTEFVAQNGATIHQSTPVSITGCTKTAKVKKARKTGRHKGKQTR